MTLPPRPFQQTRARRDFVSSYDNRAPVDYETRAVAFFDVLGWGEAVLASETDPDLRHRLLNGVWSFAARSREYIEEEMSDHPSRDEYTQFSDSLIVSFPYNEPHDLLRLLRYVAEFQRSMLLSGLPLRGGVTIGSMFHNDAIVFGPALNRAYHLESKVAKSPRVIVDREHDAVVEAAAALLPRHWGFVVKGDDEYYETAFLAEFAGTTKVRQYIEDKIDAWLDRFADNKDVLSKYQGLKARWDSAKALADKARA